MNQIKQLNLLTRTDQHKSLIRSQPVEIDKKNWTVKIKPEFERKLFVRNLIQLNKIYLVRISLNTQSHKLLIVTKDEVSYIEKLSIVLFNLEQRLLSRFNHPPKKPEFALKRNYNQLVFLTVNHVDSL
jgi:Ulp1 family protease